MIGAVEVFGIEHIDLTVADLERSIAFYDKVMPKLGFRRIGEENHARWGNPHMSFAIRPATAAQARVDFNRYRPGLHHLAFKAASRAAVDEFHRFLVREGLPVLDTPAEYPQYGKDYYALFFSDPDGMKLELAHFPWGYWRRAQETGVDERARHSGARHTSSSDGPKT